MYINKNQYITEYLDTVHNFLYVCLELSKTNNFINTTSIVNFLHVCLELSETNNFINTISIDNIHNKE